ncbi:hypothetical protein Dhaf_4470 [Desulfitobacterium hafniense DCB-2]|uniref:Uncharacterized protein n=1 Tax=Desulfitobacterium hafniense (strain DSM 10664 / DCB-2) TaxID=272564 RepID=B8FVS0_DESHD|nr:hypothetical protein Dhaf_4470 [Desulfitobacterium hafniense DCB-2]
MKDKSKSAPSEHNKTTLHAFGKLQSKNKAIQKELPDG